MWAKVSFPINFPKSCCAHHENTVTNLLVFLGGNRHVDHPFSGNKATTSAFIDVLK